MKSSLLLLLMSIISLYGGQITQYGPVNYISEMVQCGDTLMLATGGGVVNYSLSENRTLGIEHDIEQMPDIKITSLFKASDGVVWAGSQSGYLYERIRYGKWIAHDAFLPSKISVHRIKSYGSSYLLVAHSKGISVFDKKRGIALSTAFEFTDKTITGNVWEILVVGDTLFANVEKSVVRFDSLATGVTSFTFRSKKSWNFVTSGEEAFEGLSHDSKGIHSFERRVIQYGDTLVRGDKQIDTIIAVPKWGSNPPVIEKYDTIFHDMLYREVKGVIIDSTKNGDKVSSLLRLESGEIVSALAHEYLLRDALDSNRHAVVDGLVHGVYNKTILTSNGDLWLMPPTWEYRRPKQTWRGITQVKKNSVHFYNYKSKNFGAWGEEFSPLGLASDRDGNVWVGTHSEAVKQWNAKDSTWYAWKFNRELESVARCAGVYDGGWQKIDGIVSDSSGFMWFVFWTDKGDGDNKKRLAVYDPKTNKSKFLYPFLNGSISKENAVNNIQCAVDSKGNRYFFGQKGYLFGGQNDVIIIPWNVDPFSDSIEVLGKGFRFLSSLPNVDGITSVVPQYKGGALLLTSQKGVSLFRSDVKNEMGTITVDSTNNDPWVNDFKKAAVSLAIENCSVSHGGGYDSTVITSFWVSISEIGVVRMVLEEKILKGINTVRLLLSKGERPIVISSEKFAFAKNASLAIDRNNGVLWMASENGLGKYMIGAIPELGIPDNSHAKMYPNPYSKSNHSQITIDGLSPNSYVDIYTLSGKLVAHFDQQTGEELRSTGLGKLFSWKLPAGIAPGTYLVALKDSEKRDATELKKLVVIP